jgi:hypothetical protein
VNAYLSVDSGEQLMRRVVVKELNAEMLCQVKSSVHQSMFAGATVVVLGCAHLLRADS